MIGLVFLAPQGSFTDAPERMRSFRGIGQDHDGPSRVNAQSAALSGLDEFSVKNCIRGQRRRRCQPEACARAKKTPTGGASRGGQLRKSDHKTSGISSPFIA